jgi:hypothetical protein
MQNTVAKKQNYVTRMATAVTQLMDTYAELRQLRQEWTAQGYTSITQDDLSGGLSHLTPTILGNAWGTYDKIEQLISTTGGQIAPDAGHLTNLYNMVS